MPMWGNEGALVEVCPSMVSGERAQELLRLTHSKHGVAPWRPCMRDMNLEKELTQYVAEYGTKREAFRERSAQAITGIAVDDPATDGL